MIRFLKKNAFAFVMVFVVIAVMAVYTNFSRIRIRNYAIYTVEQNAQRIAGQIDTFTDSAYSSIQLTSMLASRSMNGKLFEDSRKVIDFLQPSTPFDFIEYIDKNGINTMADGEKFDASQRGYYREGIKGNSGIWINYSPKSASEFLLNFYAPVFHNDEIEGVLTGAIGCKTKMLPLINASFFGFDMIGLLCDEKGGVISTTLPIEGEASLKTALESIGIDEPSINAFYLHGKYDDKSVFRIDGKKGYSYASVAQVGKTGWTVVQIVPAPAFRSILYRSTYEQIGAVLVIILFFVLYLLLISAKFKKSSNLHKKRESQLELESLHDSLTGLLNRRAYDEEIQNIDKQLSISDISIIALDVNSLKKINDTYGHIAGDELIMGAGLCIKEVFSEIGKCYRTGGDEFAVIISRPVDDLYKRIEKFGEAQKNWHGRYVGNISVSLGVANAKDYPRASLKRLLHIADEQMYENKHAYYENETSSKA